MRRLVLCALLVAGCHQPSTFALTLTASPILDEDPLAGVDTLELRWPGRIDHVAFGGAATMVEVTPPALTDGARLEVAAISAGNVVAVGRTAPLAAGARAATAYVALPNRFVATPSARPPASARFGASATLLGDGRVLIAGGATRGSPGVPDPASITNAVDLYDPADGTFAPFMAAGFAERIYHAAGPTRDGGVLFAGGLGKFGPLDDVYVIDAAAARSVGKLPAPRWGAAAAALGDGTLLVVGGYTSSDGAGAGTLATDAVVVGADGGTRSIALPSPRAFAIATLLADGRVLVSGGSDDMGPRDDALVFIPSAGTVAAATGARAAMLSPRVGHSATLLPSGSVFVFGGNDGRASVAAPELFSPDAGGFVDAPIFNVAPRQRHAAATLADGSVLLAGGESSPQKSATPSPVHDPLLWHVAGVLTDDLSPAPARAEATATTLLDGSVLYLGGGVGDPRSLAGGAELFVPCFGPCLAVTP
jgi:hypothetical protein